MKINNIGFDYERFKKLFNFYGKEYGLAPQTSQLRFETEIIPGNGLYEFLVNPNGGVPRKTERWLRRNDAFVVKSIFVGMMIENIAKVGHAPILTYPVPGSDALPTGYIGFANSDAEALYNGSMSIITGQTSNYQDIPLRRFRYVPETQPAIVYNPGGDAQSLQLLPQYYSDDASLDFPEQFTFAGTQDQKIRIEFPSVPTTNIVSTDPTNYKVYLVVLVDGWKIEGGTNALLKTDDNPIGKAI